ncbi:hypothetical protein HDU83_009421 [Entophlyctis luteolus]|nr:hypothetical protein HDU83_009421 [Entophlyctis luteolus]
MAQPTLKPSDSPTPERQYMRGFGNHFDSTAITGALPEDQNSPLRCPFGLYAEQLSGSAFTAPRSTNLRTWLYRIRPSVAHTPYRATATLPSPSATFSTRPENFVATPVQLRWNPFALPVHGRVSFIDGIRTIAGCGDPTVRSGLGISLYSANANMEREAFYNADGDMLIVPQLGRLIVRTELGVLEVSPTEIVVIPRGIKFAVNLLDGPSRGYILETYDRHWELPDLGPIGANGLANPHDFLAPVAAFEECDGSEFTVRTKYCDEMFEYVQHHSAFDVVAWRGNYYPYKYDLKKFNTIGSISFDHPDPSIFTVLTIKSGNPGTALADFVIFPPRWLVAEHTFRPPWFHRNCASEFMGLIEGSYDAKSDGAFLPGGASLHSTFTAHGPDTATVNAQRENAPPAKTPPGIAFMFETSCMLRVARWALAEDAGLQKDYMAVWGGFEKRPLSEYGFCVVQKAMNKISLVLGFSASVANFSQTLLGEEIKEVVSGAGRIMYKEYGDFMFAAHSDLTVGNSAVQSILRDIAAVFEFLFGSHEYWDEDFFDLKGAQDIVGIYFGKLMQDPSMAVGGINQVFLDSSITERLDRLLSFLESHDGVCGNGTMLMLDGAVLLSRFELADTRKVLGVLAKLNPKKKLITACAQILQYTRARPLGAAAARFTPVFCNDAWHNLYLVRVGTYVLAVLTYIDKPYDAVSTRIDEFRAAFAQSRLEIPVEEPPLLLRLFAKRETLAMLYHNIQTGWTIFPQLRPGPDVQQKEVLHTFWSFFYNASSSLKIPGVVEFGVTKDQYRFFAR